MYCHHHLIFEVHIGQLLLLLYISYGQLFVFIVPVICESCLLLVLMCMNGRLLCLIILAIFLLQASLMKSVFRMILFSNSDLNLAFVSALGSLVAFVKHFQMMCVG